MQPYMHAYECIKHVMTAACPGQHEVHFLKHAPQLGQPVHIDVHSVQHRISQTTSVGACQSWSNRLELHAHQEIKVVAMGNNFMATIGAMNMIRQLHDRAALVQVEGMGYQRPMLVRPAIQMAIHNVPCAVHTCFIHTWVVPDEPLIRCCPAFSGPFDMQQVNTCCIIDSMLQLR